MATNPRGEMKSYSLVKALVYGGQNEAVDNNLFKSGADAPRIRCPDCERETEPASGDS